ncbi:hypothetical protein BpHYR1_052764 [Brachionus plicatilis]|uniref:Uncharacterized protein n=1 Tax=Brachionus plicatilis TaxID=10195 RepID=A0A3M7T0Z1_BRAPC|nr:hypothetical protein BpHYR1_052764 [Brachionus plicatilis]
MSKLIFLIATTLIANIACDTCDFASHPTYGRGSCVQSAWCPNSLYVSGLCESKPASVKCCYSNGQSTSLPSVCTSRVKLSQYTAISVLNANGITVSSSGNCATRTNPKCTALDQINCRSIAELVNYKRSSGCAVIMTGGSETGHSSGTYSHWTGYKIDIGLNSCHSSYIRSRFTYAGKRGDGADLYKDARGNTWALEGNHWDILFP